MRLPTYFVSHGGGPWPWMKDQFGSAMDKLEASIVDIRRQIGVTPRAILMVSGHWENRNFTVSSNAAPPMVYDYYGFPAHTYLIKYPAPGSPELARQVQQLLQSGGVDCADDPQRGFDHGTFTVSYPLYPVAEVPIVQLSLRNDYNPSAHIEVGKLLAPLRDENVLIIGSGLSYHNLRRFYDPSGAAPSRQFDEWLQETLVQHVGTERDALLEQWAQAPAARVAHPNEDHLIPLMVAVGAAHDEPGVCVYHQDDFAKSLSVSSFRFGAAAN